MTLEAEAADQVVHAVEAAQDRALAAAGWADEARDLAALDLHVAVADPRVLMPSNRRVDAARFAQSLRPYHLAVQRLAHAEEALELVVAVPRQRGYGGDV